MEVGEDSALEVVKRFTWWWRGSKEETQMKTFVKGFGTSCGDG